MIRLCDFFLSLFGLIFLSPILILLTIIGLIENGSPFFIQKRVGHSQKLFVIIKFRTMSKDTVSVATHLVKRSAITPFGYFLRKTKLDEIPQLWNVLIGDMSLVGPRPCLLNQKKLIQERKKRGLYQFKPGITGLAQLIGVTMKNPILLAKTDLKMIRQMTLIYYFYYIFSTLLLVFKNKK